MDLLRMSVGGEETEITGWPPARKTLAISSDEPQVGALFAARYEIQSVLGKGGMGTVYKAHDRELDELVAIKTLRHQALWADPWLRERFKQEIRLARRITHANVLRTHDLGEWNGLKFLSMEFVEGQTLEQVLESEILPTPVALRIAKQVCAGLAAAHEVGVIHGDIKPQNIIVEPAGGLKIMDFGSAHLTDERGLTAAGTVIGTLGYMSPEQARGLPLNFRSDIYSTGIMLYELFTGSLPFEGDSPLAVVLKHVHNAPPLPRSKNPRIDAKVAAIITKCIEKDAAFRFQSVGELYEALAQVTVERGPQDPGGVALTADPACGLCTCHPFGIFPTGRHASPCRFRRIHEPFRPPIRLRSTACVPLGPLGESLARDMFSDAPVPKSRGSQ